MIRFDWNSEKERRNYRKHRVTFAEAQTVFDDPLARIDNDPDHSEEELRELLVGYSMNGRLLVVSFVERDEAIRIVSAREADPAERQRHEEETL